MKVNGFLHRVLGLEWWRSRRRRRRSGELDALARRLPRNGRDGLRQVAVAGKTLRSTARSTVDGRRGSSETRRHQHLAAGAPSPASGRRRNGRSSGDPGASSGFGEIGGYDNTPSRGPQLELETATLDTDRGFWPRTYPKSAPTPSRMRCGRVPRHGRHAGVLARSGSSGGGGAIPRPVSVFLPASRAPRIGVNNINERRGCRSPHWGRGINGGGSRMERRSDGEEPATAHTSSPTFRCRLAPLSRCQSKPASTTKATAKR